MTHGDNLASSAAITRLLCAQKRRVSLIGANDLHPPVAFIIQRCLIYRPPPVDLFHITAANNGLAPGSRFAWKQPQRLDTLMLVCSIFKLHAGAGLVGDSQGALLRRIERHTIHLAITLSGLRLSRKVLAKAFPVLFFEYKKVSAS